MHRIVNFLSADTVGYLLGMEESSGLTTTLDIVDGQQQVDYTLQFLPADDAFYTFQGWLGERRLLPGRDGPPGAMYRSLLHLW